MLFSLLARCETLESDFSADFLKAESFIFRGLKRQFMIQFEQFPLNPNKNKNVWKVVSFLKLQWMIYWWKPDRRSRTVTSQQKEGLFLSAVPPGSWRFVSSLVTSVNILLLCRLPHWASLQRSSNNRPSVLPSAPPGLQDRIRSNQDRLCWGFNSCTKITKSKDWGNRMHPLKKKQSCFWRRTIERHCRRKFSRDAGDTKVFHHFLIKMMFRAETETWHEEKKSSRNKHLQILFGF